MSNDPNPSDGGGEPTVDRRGNGAPGGGDGAEAGDSDETGQRIDEVVDRIKDVRDGAADRAAGADQGVLLDQMDEVEQRLLEFGRALGGNPTTVADIPFTEEAATDSMPEPLYVRHDTELLNQVTSWLLQDQHIGLISPYGTGKSAFREIVRRDLGAHDRFVVAFLPNPRETTPRQLYQTILQASFDAGYELDTEQYWQTRDGVPWATDEARQAVGEIVETVRSEGRTLLLIVDEIEVLPAELLSPLQVAADAGVRLFLSGTPEGKERIAELRGTLDSRLRYYNGILPFEPEDIEEYVSRSLAYFRGEPYEGQGQDLFTWAALEDIHEQTGGVPREVRIDCRELFTRAAFVWYRTGQDVDRIQITPQLRNQRYGMNR